MLHDDSIELLFRLFAHDTDTAYHCCRVAGMVEKMSNYLKLSASEKEIYFSGALLHDIGKSRVAPQILKAPRALSSDEMSEIRMHPVWGEEFAKICSYPEDVCKLIRWHHERLDGSGYPDKLMGDELSDGVRLIGLCDSIDAMAHYRPYHTGCSKEECYSRLSADASLFDEHMMEMFFQNWDDIIRPE